MADGKIVAVSIQTALTADVFEALDLRPEQFLTEGGLVNRGKLRAAFWYPHDYLPEGHWMRAADSQRLELSPEFTDTARAALLWVLWHHQGRSSPIGQPIRFALGMGAHEPLSEHQVQEALRWGRITKSRTSDFHGA